MRLDRHWIQSHIPHTGTMCLLDEILSWDERRVRSRSSTHLAPDNPLRAYGRLGAVCGIEYAAQTMAVHGALIARHAGTPAPQGLLASLRAVTLYVSRLDDLEGDLIASAECVASDGHTALYEFAVTAAERPVVSGRAAIAFKSAGLFAASPGQLP
jgi:predicted hotdog family 3-hydroxylacyl-ACP dehydratase